MPALNHAGSLMAMGLSEAERADTFHHWSASMRARVAIVTALGPERDMQLQHVNRHQEVFLASGEPAISVGIEKKQLIGDFKNTGRAWCLEPKRCECVIRAKGFATTEALVILAHKLLRVTFAVCKRHAGFDPAKLMPSPA